MSDKITLTEDELHEITGYKLARYQKRHFDGLGVPSVLRPDGSLSVVRAHLLNYRPPRAGNDEPTKRVKQAR